MAINSSNLLFASKNSVSFKLKANFEFESWKFQVGKAPKHFAVKLDDKFLSLDGILANTLRALKKLKALLWIRV